MASRLSSERGSILVEVLVGTVLLALTTAAVLDGLNGAQKTGRMNKDRSVAATLAQQDLERMRSLPPALLASLNQTRTVTVANVPYTVVSRTLGVRDANGLVSCTADDSASEYFKLTSTVHSPASADRPVTATSLLTPPPGVFGDDAGTAAIKLTDRDGLPWEGVTVDLQGPSSYSDATNDEGCAVFSFIAVDDWTAEVDGGLVTWSGETPARSQVTVAADRTSLSQIELDRPASLRATFVTPSGLPAHARAVSVANSKLPNGYKPFAAATPPAASIDAENLFPFKDGYGVFAGDCEANNPAVWDSDYFATSPYGYVAPEPAALLEPVQVMMPLLTVVVTRVSSQTFNAARVSVRQIDSAYDCEEVVYNSEEVAPSTGGREARIQIPLPFGRYEVCAATRRSSWNSVLTGGSVAHPNLRVAPYERTVAIQVGSGSGSCDARPPT